MPVATDRGRGVEAVSYTRVTAEISFDIIRARFVRHRFVPHAHTEYAIGVVEQGCGRLEHTWGVDDHQPGSIVVIPPGLVHTGFAADESVGWGYRMLYLPVPYVTAAVARAGYSSDLPIRFAPAIRDDDLGRRIADIHCRMEASPGDHGPWELALRELLADLVRRHALVLTPPRGRRGQPSPRMQAVRTMIDKSFMRPLSIQAMAAVAGLSETYLIRAFHRAYGLPPYMYLEQLRVQYARTLIERGSSIVDAALDAGFTDQSHLTRRFKQTLGITPGVIARRSDRTTPGCVSRR